MTHVSDIERLQLELDAKIRQQESFNPARGIIFGTVFSLPFWLAVAWGVWKGVVR